MPKISIPKNEIKNGTIKHKYRTQGITAQTIELLEDKIKRRQAKVAKLNKEIEECSGLLAAIKIHQVDKNKV